MKILTVESKYLANNYVFLHTSCLWYYLSWTLFNILKNVYLFVFSGCLPPGDSNSIKYIRITMPFIHTTDNYNDVLWNESEELKVNVLLFKICLQNNQKSIPLLSIRQICLQYMSMALQYFKYIKLICIIKE